MAVARLFLALGAARALDRPRVHYVPEHGWHPGNGPERPARLDDVCVRSLKGGGDALELNKPG